ncbi:MAG: hypothetical protein F6J93_04290 [Oscillatoria sp. SIO1A7]|nr:hypothetical protein [Oscillatoria sp. SIO1A7]
MSPLDPTKIAKPLAGLALGSFIALALPLPWTNKYLWAQTPAPDIPNPSGAPIENYRIRPGDNIRIDNLEGREFSGDYLVPPDGSLSLPMIGSVSVVGLTMQEAAEVIAAKYRRFFKYPQVGVSLLRISPLNITIAGEVISPGPHIILLQNLREHAGIELPTVTQALEQFGGITLAGDLSRVQVRRRESNGEERIVVLDLWEFARTGNPRQNIPLQDGDTIFVPKTDEVNLAQIRQLAAVSFATDLSTPRTVTVLGGVTRPGSYVIKGGDTTGGNRPFAGRADGLPTVIRALQLAGGVTHSADIRQIQIRRNAKTGGEQFFTINLWDFLQTGDVSQDTILQEGDTIFIPTANLSQTEIRQIGKASFAADPNIPRTVTVVGEVTRPGTIVVQAGDTVGINTQFASRIEGFPTLTRVLQLAGGVTRSADIRNIQIRRRSRSGTQRVINVSLWDFLQTGDLDRDPIVEDGDTIVIPIASNFNDMEARRIGKASFAADPNLPRTVTVVGEVTRPGTIIVQGGDTVGINTQFASRTEGLPTLTRVLQVAGGVTLSADIRKIQIRRRSSDDTERVINVNLWEFLQTGDLARDPIVEDGDTILIPIANNFNEMEARQIGKASFAADPNIPRTVTVVGEVTRPGTIVVRGGDTVGVNTQFASRTEGLPTLTRVLQLVGGVTRSADIRKIQIRRLTRSDIERVIDVNLVEFLQTGDLARDPIVEDGDTIVIPIASNFNEIEARRIADTSFAANSNTPRTVTVVGEVRRPGPIVVEGGDTVGINTQFASRIEGLPTLTRSIQLAGGITELADIRRIQLRRATKSGAERVISVNLWELLQTGDASQDPVVEQGDTIVVPRGAEVNPAEAARLASASFSPNTISIYIMGEAARAPTLRQDGAIELPSGTPLNQALLAAGVFNSVRANKSEVALIRLNADGTVNQRRIKVNLEDGINEESNPLLRNNDVLFINRSGFTKVRDASGTVAELLLVGPRLLSWFQLLDIFGILNIN